MDEIMGETEEFNTLAFEKKLLQLKDTQESIQGLSSWCLKQREHHKKIVSSWLNVLKRVKVEQRLTLFYLANDVIQYSKRKNYEFVESWGLYLQKATPLVRDEKVRPKILRILKIWEQRGVYDDDFLSDLTGLLSSGVVAKKADDDPLDFQPQQLVNKIRQCTVLESDTDLRLKQIHDCPLPLNDAETLSTSLKERSNKDDVEKELNEGIQCVERYSQALQREIVAREALLALLTSANQYYSTQRGEVKVVAYAYKNFGSRVRALKRKLDELTPTLPLAAPPSPPRRDEDVPSPSPDEDLDLPQQDADVEDVSYNIDRTFNTSMSADGSLYNLGLSSFLSTADPMAIFNDTAPSDPNSNNGKMSMERYSVGLSSFLSTADPMAIFNDTAPSDANSNNGNKIEVINNRPNEKQDFDINSFLKTLIPSNSDVSNNNNSESRPPSDSQHVPLAPPPPPSFYGANDDPEPYHPETCTQWTTPSWSLPSIGCTRDTPQSPPPLPPPAPLPAMPAIPTIPSAPYAQHSESLPAVDVDHRGLLPPPPPPPVLPLLSSLEDVDHRLLPALPPPSVAPRPTAPQQDVDHRNLISLTQLPPAPPVSRGPCEDQDYRSAAPLPPPPVPPPVPVPVPVSVPFPAPVSVPFPAPVSVPVRAPAPVPPPDIVESVDMDLSEDEEHRGDQRMYGVQQENRRNNKVLVGGNGTRSPLTNPFDSMPPTLSAFTQPFYQNQNQNQNYKEDTYQNQNFTEDIFPNQNFKKDVYHNKKFKEDGFQSNSNNFKGDDSDDSAYEEDLRSRSLLLPNIDHMEQAVDEWRGQFTPRFPSARPWGPRARGPVPWGPRAPGPGPQRWPGPRPQRFW